MITQNISIAVAESIIHTIGETPLIKLHRIIEHRKFNLFGKLEAANPGRNLKDRTSLYILQEAFAEGRIKTGDTVVESSSGNMALGLAQA
ncbi:pyridoxal-phosphate dependent enzyme [Maribacter sp. ACAM166]|uniref:pyridoxal-phosphate dependent enzyme n=1 Tax=Maribacter sp. ACAM166 TaxID=2508996 RepID=UPI0010FD497E|nr:pyridoxal-phosphate dependent enzyme [Maribacter sp. ACAM166]TLP77252.1 pyridoxal-phosphate dependent enzyme [Maribacter sp. ACAM166]